MSALAEARVCGTRLVVLYSSLDDPDWPDFLDLGQGTFTYYGDNKRAGHALENTARGGNALLRECFDRIHAGNRAQTPPFFVFTKGNKGRNVTFRGVAVPSIDGLPTDDLVAVWKVAEVKRFRPGLTALSDTERMRPRHRANESVCFCGRRRLRRRSPGSLRSWAISTVNRRMSSSQSAQRLFLSPAK